jgi:hypothetical protein
MADTAIVADEPLVQRKGYPQPMTPKLPKAMTLLGTAAVLIGAPILVVAVFDRPEPVHTSTPQELAKDQCAEKIMAEETDAFIAGAKA